MSFLRLSNIGLRSNTRSWRGDLPSRVLRRVAWYIHARWLAGRASRARGQHPNRLRSQPL